jgi:hypothetical protein
MLALSSDCVLFCLEKRHTPLDLYHHVSQVLSDSQMDPDAYRLVFDWCCMAAQPGTDTNSASSMISFATPAVLGMSGHLHTWAHNKLQSTLGSPHGSNEPPPDQGTGDRGTAGSASGEHRTMDVNIITQVTAAVVAALRAEQQNGTQTSKARAEGRTAETQKSYSEFQLAKLKGFSCVRTESSLQPIWQYFKSTKEVDTQRTQLLEEMRQWARMNDIQIHQSVYFDKPTGPPRLTCPPPNKVSPSWHVDPAWGMRQQTSAPKNRPCSQQGKITH